MEINFGSRPTRDKRSKKTNDGLIAFETSIVQKFPLPLIYAPMGNTFSGENPMIYDAPLREWELRVGWAHQTEQGFMNVIESLEGQYNEAKELWSKYEDKLKSFRSVVKNDVASLEASGRAAFLAVNKIRDAHNKTLEIMNSAEMERAIQNAERLADALERIQALKSHKLTLAVLDASPKEQP